MHRLRQLWNRVKRPAMVVGAIGFVVVVLIVGVGLLFAPTDPPRTGNVDTPAEAPHTPTGPGKPATGPDDRPLPLGEQGSLLSKEQMPPLRFDETGVAVMEATNNPAVAAASAAQVLLSAQGTKVRFAEDFRGPALRRIMHPSDNYVGVGEQLTVTAGGTALTGNEFEPLILATQSKVRYSPSAFGQWWMLADERFFPQGTIESRAIAVYGDEEISDLVGSEEPWMTLPPQYQLKLTKPGASFGLYWVRVERTTIPGEGAAVRMPAAFAIYCDPPTESGLCGVVDLWSGYPPAWKQ